MCAARLRPINYDGIYEIFCVRDTIGGKVSVCSFCFFPIRFFVALVMAMSAHVKNRNRNGANENCSEFLTRESVLGREGHISSIYGSK